MNPAAKRRQAITLADNSAGIVGRAISIRARLRTILLSPQPFDDETSNLLAASIVDTVGILKLLGVDPHD